ncbi:TPA: glycosyltransferase [Yersinia enterocolitica]
MKVLYIITGLGMGGAEIQTCLIADKVYDAGNDVMIISLTGKTLIKPSNNIPVIELNIKKNILSFFYSLFKTRTIIKKFEPTVVHSHMFHANIFSRLLRILTRVPYLICTAHNTNEGNKIRMLAYRWTDKLASISTNVSDEAVDAFINKGASFPGRMINVPNGIDTEKFKYNESTRINKRQELKINNNKIMLLSVGRLTEAKDYPNLLKAYSLLVNNEAYSDKTVLYIVGAGHLENYLKLMTKELNISDHVIFMGIRDDIPELMCASDLFILPSAWEGFGLVVAEAMACQRLVVATDSGGVKEVIGNYGFLVPAKDDIALYDSIVIALNLPKTKKIELGLSARKRIINNNSIDKVAKVWIDLYNHFSLER